MPKKSNHPDITSLRPVFRAYGLEVRKVQIVREVYRLETLDGDFCLKKTPLAPERLLFLSAVTRHLVERGFPWVAPVLPAGDGSPCLNLNGENYYLTPWLEGSEGDFANDRQIEAIATTLARYHLAAREFDPPPGSAVKVMWGKWPEVLQRRYGDLLEVKQKALSAKAPDEFETLYLKEADYFLEHSARALEMLKGSPYPQLVEEYQSRRTLCHYDVGTRNFIFSPSGDAYLIDFDLARFDIPVKDLSMLIYRALAKREWSFTVFTLIFDSYRKVVDLSPEEIEILGILLLFPQKFWRLSSRYYNRYHGWTEKRFAHSLYKYTRFSNSREQFLKEYGSRYLGRPLV